MFKKLGELINDFLLIQPQDENGGQKLLENLNKIVDFKSAYIFYTSPGSLKLSHSYNPQKNFKLPPKGPFLSADLTINKTPYAKLVITRGKEFTDDEAKIFKVCAVVISNKIKDLEIAKITNMQITALQEGIVDVMGQNKKILEADKIKTDFLANVSHELRTPLNSIIGFSDLLSQDFGGPLTDKQRTFVAEIKAAGIHLLGMINGILDVSKLEARAMKLRPTEFMISLSINEAINIIKPLAAKKNIKLNVEMKDDLVKADYQKIQQILFNLLSNAIKFSPENSTVEISVKPGEIVVRDYGVGIAKKYHSKIFQKFEQITNPGLAPESSTGLGLTITKELVKLHKGKIKVESALGEGTKFIVSLPHTVI